MGGCASSSPSAGPGSLIVFVYVQPFAVSRIASRRPPFCSDLSFANSAGGPVRSRSPAVCARA
eukprot:607391-Alexandrium_andersonii.AAC.1